MMPGKNAGRPKTQSKEKQIQCFLRTDLSSLSINNNNQDLDSQEKQGNNSDNHD